MGDCSAFAWPGKARKKRGALEGPRFEVPGLGSDCVGPGILEIIRNTRETQRLFHKTV